MVYTQWKQRLYAFLLRRILGPYLSKDSLGKLHESIEVSFQEGRFSLKEIDLSSEFLTEVLNEKVPDSKCRIVGAQCSRLQINLSLKEYATSAEATSSLAWRAMNLGSEQGVSLFAEVQVEGLEVHMEPMTEPTANDWPPSKQQTHDADVGSAESLKASPSSMISSYLDAALSSLRLSLRLVESRLRIGSSTQGARKWIEIGLSSLQYYDLDARSEPHPPESQKLRVSGLQKAFDYSGLSLRTGSSSSHETDQIESFSPAVAKTEGTGRIIFRAQSCEQIDGVQIQQDAEISLNQRLNVSVDEGSLRDILSVLQALDPLARSPENCEATHDAPSIISVPAPSAGALPQIEEVHQEDDDEADIKTVQGIIKQYEEARHLAETKEVRGGILLPNTDHGSISFDAFFDANDKSFHRYASVMQASRNQGDPANHLQCQIKVFLRELQVKLIFPTPNCERQTGMLCQPAEYALLSIGDINLTYTSSGRSSSASFSMSHVLLESARIVHVPRDRREIMTLLRFAEISSDDTMEESLVSAPACVIVDYSATDMNRAMDIRLEPFDIVLCQSTIRNLSYLAKSVEIPPRTGNNDDQPRPARDQNGATQPTSITVVCPWITICIPLGHEVDNVDESIFHHLLDGIFSRCGYQTSKGRACGTSCIGISFEEILLERTIASHAMQDDGELVSSQKAIVFVERSKDDDFGRITGTERIDLVALSGQAPITLRRRVSAVGSPDSVGKLYFPVLPSISSFKARQDDSDDDNDDDKIGSAEHQNLHSAALKPVDPQPAMIRIAQICDEVFQVGIPDLSVDVSNSELESLSRLVQSAIGPSDRSSSLQTDDRKLTSTRSRAFSLHIEHVNIFLHHDSRAMGAENEGFSFAIVGNAWGGFAAATATNQSCCRVLARGFDFFYVEGSSPQQKMPVSRGIPSTIEDQCAALHQRISRFASSRAKPIVIESKLFNALSPNCPVLLLDIFQRERGGERSLFFSMYNITYRFDIDSEWTAKLQEFVRPINDSFESKSKEATNPPEVSLTKVFITFADCNIHYVSPSSFCRASHMIVRFSDVRLSSNLVVPSGPVQAFRLSIGDVSIQLSNRRCSHEDENARLPRAAMIFGIDALPPVKTDIGVALRNMNLVTMLTLDSLNASILMRKDNQGNPQDPKMTISISFGALCFYGCKDSFQCFTDTLSELNLRLTGLSNTDLRKMRESQKSSPTTKYPSPSTDHFFDASAGHTHERERPDSFSHSRLEEKLLDERHYIPEVHEDFSLDGYDWTTVDHVWTKETRMPRGEEQAARWYGAYTEGRRDGESGVTGVSENYIGQSSMAKKGGGIRIISHHISLQEAADALSAGDMDAAAHAGTSTAPFVDLRILVRDLKLRCRFFDGYDWPQDIETRDRDPKKKHELIIEEALDSKKIVKKDAPPKIVTSRKVSLMGTLLDGEQSLQNDQRTFKDIPIPEERIKHIRNRAEEQRIARRLNRFLQLSLSGLTARVDTFQESVYHQLASCVEVQVRDLFVAETLSQDRPVKLLGEWVNETEHPRDSCDGLITMKMVTWRSAERVSQNFKINNDESKAVLHILPLRCHVHQRAVRFARIFFGGNDDEKPESPEWATGLTEIPPPLFRSFKVKSCKTKVDYSPEKMDLNALRDGAVVELINLSPLNDMVIVLRAVWMEEKVGFGSVIGELTSSWIRDICDSQLYKFVTNASPFHPIAGITEGATDMVLLPWDAIKNGDDVKRALTSGISYFAGTIAFETLNAGAKLTSFAARRLAMTMSGTTVTPMNMGSPPHRSSSNRHRGHSSNAAAAPLALLPSRPTRLPLGVGDTAGHALESIARGVEAANYKIIIIPYREYQSKGVASAAKSVVKGIPVAVLAPVGGASEALSYALLGARNLVRPEIRKEEEASRRGLQYDF